MNSAASSSFWWITLASPLLLLLLLLLLCKTLETWCLCSSHHSPNKCSLSEPQRHRVFLFICVFIKSKLIFWLIRRNIPPGFIKCNCYLRRIPKHTGHIIVNVQCLIRLWDSGWFRDGNKTRCSNYSFFFVCIINLWT